MRNRYARQNVVPDMKRFAIIAAAASALGACMTYPPPPPAPYHAVGQGGWTLIIDDRYLTFIPAPGQQPILQPSVRPIIGVAGEIYQTPRINVNVVHGPCQVIGDGRTFPDTVQVYVDGRLHTGCGGL